MTNFRAKTAAVLLVLLGSVTGFGGLAHAQTDATYRWGALSATEDEVDTPTAVGNLGDITEIAAGNASALALTSSGTVYTWGLGMHGELGQGNTADSVSSAVEVPGLPTIAGIAEFQDTDVAWTASGTAYGWGYNENGGLCTGDKTQYDSPIELTNLSGVVSVAGGAGHAEYLLSNGSIVGCGQNQDGQLGNGTTSNSTTPVTVEGLPVGPTVTQISAGNLTTSAVLSDGTVWMWGDGEYGQLGNGTKTNSDIATQVALPSAAAQVYSGGNVTTDGQSLALLQNGQVYGWGNNAYGQLGDGTTKTNNTVPVLASALPSGPTWSYVVTGAQTSYAVDTSGDVYAFGNDSVGQCGDGGSSGSVLTPELVQTGVNLLSSTADDVVSHVP
jgi:alpha-tubulin suppressor-like RCC1 family protein